MQPLLQSSSISAPSDGLPFVSESPAPTQDVLGDTGWLDWHLEMGLFPPASSMYYLLIPAVHLLTIDLSGYSEASEYIAVDIALDRNSKAGNHPDLENCTGQPVGTHLLTRTRPVADPYP